MRKAGALWFYGQHDTRRCVNVIRLAVVHATSLELCKWGELCNGHLCSRNSPDFRFVKPSAWVHVYKGVHAFGLAASVAEAKAEAEASVASGSERSRKRSNQSHQWAISDCLRCEMPSTAGRVRSFRTSNFRTLSRVESESYRINQSTPSTHPHPSNPPPLLSVRHVSRQVRHLRPQGWLAPRMSLLSTRPPCFSIHARLKNQPSETGNHRLVALPCLALPRSIALASRNGERTEHMLTASAQSSSPSASSPPSLAASPTPSAAPRRSSAPPLPSTPRARRRRTLSSMSPSITIRRTNATVASTSTSTSTTTTSSPAVISRSLNISPCSRKRGMSTVC